MATDLCVTADADSRYASVEQSVHIYLCIYKTHMTVQSCLYLLEWEMIQLLLLAADLGVCAFASVCINVLKSHIYPSNTCDRLTNTRHILYAYRERLK